jgi:uncharacterized membrane protein
MTYSPSTLDRPESLDRGLLDRSKRMPAEAQWQGGGQAQQGKAQQIEQGERWTALASGAILAGLGLARRGVPGMICATVGGAMIYQGATGRPVIGRSFGADAPPQGPQAEQQQLQRRLNRGLRVTQAFTIDRSPEELYQFWRNFENLPRIMTHLESVRVLDDRRSHWIARLPKLMTGKKLEWDAEITDDVPNDRISWRSLPGSDIDTAGTVRFARGDRGSIVRVEMQYVAPAGRMGNWIAKLFGEVPERVIREDLRNFKRQMEVGEIPTIIGQPRGTCRGHGTREGE